MSTIDKEMWQSIMAHYKALNEAKFRESVRNAGKETLLQKWRKFLDMMEFGLLLKPHPSKNEQKQKIEMLNEYYEQIQRFEARRTQSGK